MTTNRTALIARDLTASAILDAARRIGTDRHGNGPSLASICEAIGRNDAHVTSVFFHLCMTGEYPGSKSTHTRFA